MRTAVQLLKHRPDGDRDLSETLDEREKAVLWRQKESMVKWALIFICMGGAIAYGTQSVLLICVMTCLIMACGRVHEWIPSEKTARLNKARARRYRQPGAFDLFLRYDPVNVLQSSGPILTAITVVTSLLVLLIVVVFGNNALFPAMGMFWLGALGMMLLNFVLDRAERIRRTDLLLNRDGIRFDWTRDWRTPAVLFFEWQQIQSVSFTKTKTLGIERTVLQFRLSIQEWGSGERSESELADYIRALEAVIVKTPANFFIEDGVDARTLVINLRSDGFASSDHRKDLVDFLNARLPAEKILSPLVSRHQNNKDVSYTDLWLDALTSTAARIRLNDLEADSTVRSGRYAIQAQLGAGGQGVAYTAIDNNVNRMVVLKEFVLPSAAKLATRKRALENVQKEATLLSQLDHSQIVKYHDFFVEDQRAYLVLEHIEGINLRKYVQEKGPIAQSMVIDLSIQMCEILAYLHGLTPAVVHRDFTPDNLMFVNFEIVKLLDFNVAQRLELAESRTVVGKHAYLPPEQFRGKATIQSDIYALGATMFFLLTGGDPEPISTSHPGLVLAEITSELDAIVAKATDTSESERYLDSAAMKADLLRLKKDQGVARVHS